MEVDPTERRDQSPHTGTPGPDLSETLWALAQTQGLLQTAVTELCRQHTRDRPKRQPSAVLTKLTPADDVEAYLEIFERTACREGWSPAEWAGLLAPLPDRGGPTSLLQPTGTREWVLREAQDGDTGPLWV